MGPSSQRRDGAGDVTVPGAAENIGQVGVHGFGHAPIIGGVTVHIVNRAGDRQDGGMSNEVGGSDPVDPPPLPPDEPPPAYAQPPVQSSAPPVYPTSGAPAIGHAPPGYPPPGYGPPGYQPPGYYAPPGYQPPGYQPPGYYGYPGYPPGYGYPPSGYPGAAAKPLKPGIIPLRPLTLSEIYNGAVAYVRMNPKATLGMTAIVVVVAQVLVLLLQIGPLAALGALEPSTFNTFGSAEPSTEALVGSLLASIVGPVTTGLAAIVLSGLLTVIVGRAVFGAKITTGGAWRRARGRLLPLIGITLLQGIGFSLLVVIAVMLAFGIGYVAGGAAGVIAGILLAGMLVILFVYVSTILLFAPALIVLERLSIVQAITRSFALVRGDFWRVLGIWFLGMFVAGLIAWAVSVPFNLVGEVMLVLSESTPRSVIALVLVGIGAAIGQIITAPFSAGVVVLLYTDRRIRAEAFDLVLQTGAVGPADAPADSTDHLWLTTQS